MHQSPKNAVSEEVVAAAAGSLITSLVMTPFDVVKIRLQAQQKPIPKGSAFLYCNGLMDHTCVCANNGSWYTKPTRNFHGTVDAFYKIAQFEGVSSLWSGLSPTLVMAIPATMIYFTMYDRLKYACGFIDNDPKTTSRAGVAGIVSRVTACCVISPLELMRTKFQSEKLNYSQLFRSMKRAVNHSGYRSLWRGLGPTVLRDVPFSGIYWFGYESMKFWTKDIFQSRPSEPKFIQSFICGSLSGSVAAVLTLPFDVVKTHRQIEIGDLSILNKGRFTPSLSVLVHLFREKGLSGLYAGIIPRIAKVAPACAIMISSFEYGKQILRHYRDSS